MFLISLSGYYYYYIMFNILLQLHSVFRWLVLISLIYSIIISARGYLNKTEFIPFHNSMRHYTATICHIQLMLGILLYIQSPQIKYYFSPEGQTAGEPFFFSILHLVLMLAAIVVITIGSAKAKRQTDSNQKYITMLLWFSAGLFLILIAIPWPFSPLANRPYIRF
jgi:hypothetical protein